MEKAEKWEIRIIENDADMLTVIVDGKDYVYNKEYGYWYDGDKDEIIDMNPKLSDEIFKRSKASDDVIEDCSGYVYHPDDDESLF